MRASWTRTPTTPTIRTATTQAPTRTRTTQASRASLERCIEPVEVDDFLGRYWEQKPLVVQRQERGRFDDLLSLEDAERLISSTALRLPGFRLVRDGKQIDPRSYTSDLRWRPSPFTGTIDVGRVADEFESGATIVLQALHHSWHPLAVFCRELEVLLGHPVQANAYYTPRSAQGLAVHHDTHDVICLQISGEKRWLVYEPALELPLKDQRYSKELGGPGDAVEDVTLTPGDTLYLPRGWLHEALTSDSDSLHVTIGVNLYTWIDAFKAAIEECGEEVDFRRSVGDDGESEADLLGLLAERLRSEDVARRRRERFVKGRRAVLDGQLEQLRALEHLTVETRLEPRPTVIAELDFPQLTFHGKVITFPEKAEAEVEFIFSAEEPFTLAELPGELDDQGRLVLARRLIREGFLRSLPA